MSIKRTATYRKYQSRTNAQRGPVCESFEPAQDPAERYTVCMKCGWIREKHRGETKQQAARRMRLLPDGKPRYVRVYDNGGETLDRYSVVFTGNYGNKTGGETWILAMNAAPFHPQGIGMHANSNRRPDWPNYGHLGKKISFDQLPDDCRKLVMQDYVYLWDLKAHPLYYEH